MTEKIDPQNTDGGPSTSGTGAAFGIGAGALALFPGVANALGPKSTGVPGPGDYNGGITAFDQTSIAAEETFETFGCKVADPIDLKTPDWKRATVYFERKVFNESMLMPDGKSVKFWGFEDELLGNGARRFPSPMMRVQEGDLVHVKLETRMGAHTIHHHGIEPTTINDGVGHVSMEVSGSYVYQWQPRHAGTWFYHCHVNTVLHFEMGLYGPLIVDPEPEGGIVKAFKGGPEYQVERLWVFDDWDPVWHEKSHEAGLCGDDEGLNVFRPKYFFASGVLNTRAMTNNNVRVVAKPTDQVLIRIINAAYSVVRVCFDSLDVEVVSVDGHALNKPWAKPFKISAGNWFELATATRYDLIIKPPKEGKRSRVRVEYTDWITRRVHGANQTNPLYVGYLETEVRFES